jgi:hypothetical protein
MPIALAFCLTCFKAQKQTFDNLIIDLWQPPDNVCLNMHNIHNLIMSTIHRWIPNATKYYYAKHMQS